MKNFLKKEHIGWQHPVGELDQGASFFQNTIIRTLLILAILPVLGSVGVLAYFIRPTEGVMVLHYNVYFGVDLLGIWWQTFLLPLLGLLFFLGHSFLAKHFYQRTERIASYLLLLGSGMLSFGILIASISVAFINY